MLTLLVPLFLLLIPTDALQRLKEGNDRFTQDKLEHPDRTRERREETAPRQSPFAVVLGCSDSRIPPEIVFDQGIGDLFVVREAGNVVSEIELESILFSVVTNQSSLVVVLGHENCGAIQAVVQKNTQSIPEIAALVQKALAQQKIEGELTVEKAVKANVRYTVDKLKQDKTIDSYIQQNKVKVVGGYYHLESGKVEFLD